MVREILKLGNLKPYENQSGNHKGRCGFNKGWGNDLHDTLMEYRKSMAGRAVAAPQIGVQKRLLYMFLDKGLCFINPVMTFPMMKNMNLWTTVCLSPD